MERCKKTVALTIAAAVASALSLFASVAAHGQENPRPAYAVTITTAHSTHHKRQRWENPAQFHADEGLGPIAVTPKK